MRPEPKLEELSAYLDHELPGAQRQEVESHLAGCETCRRRLESLRQTVHAVKELPSEVPPRAFTIPPQRAQRSRLTPAGWTAGLAAAAVLGLVVAVAINSSHGGGLPSGAGINSAASRNVPGYAPAPNGATGSGNEYDRAAAAALSALPNQSVVSDPAHPGYRLTLAASVTRINTGGTVTFRLVLGGPAVGSQPSDVRVLLVKSGVGVQIPTTAQQSQQGAAVYEGQLKPAAGSYRLTATWTVPGSSGTVLVAEVPVEVLAG